MDLYDEHEECDWKAFTRIGVYLNKELHDVDTSFLLNGISSFALPAPFHHLTTANLTDRTESPGLARRVKLYPAMKDFNDEAPGCIRKYMMRIIGTTEAKVDEWIEHAKDWIENGI